MAHKKILGRCLAAAMASTLVFGMTACQGSDNNSSGETAGTGAAGTGTGSTQESYDPLGAYDETVTSVSYTHLAKRCFGKKALAKEKFIKLLRLDIGLDKFFI